MLYMFLAIYDKNMIAKTTSKIRISNKPRASFVQMEIIVAIKNSIISKIKFICPIALILVLYYLEHFLMAY